MSELRQALQDYLAVRRALGFKLARADQRLSGFIGYLEQAGPARSPPNWPWPGRASHPAGIPRGGASG